MADSSEPAVADCNEQSCRDACPGDAPGIVNPSELVSRAGRDRLVRLAYRFLWNRDDAEDAVQDSLAIAHQRVGELRDRTKWWTWLYRILVQRCQLLGRQRQRRRRQMAAYAAEEFRRREAAAERSTREVKDLIRDVLPRLPKRQNEVLVLRHLEDMSYETISEVLGIAPSTARVHAQAGREALRETILRHDSDAFAGSDRQGDKEK